MQYFGGEYRFLTQITHVLTTIYFAVALLADLQRVLWRKRSTALTVAKELLFSLGVVCASMTVILFWGLYLLVSPDSVGYSTVYPDDLNRFQHGFVALLVWADLLLCRHELLPATAHFKMSLAFIFGYIGWMKYTTTICGNWPYPFLDVLPLSGHLIFYASTVVFSSVLLCGSLYSLFRHLCFTLEIALA
jgi:hypothetical protein